VNSLVLGYDLLNRFPRRVGTTVSPSCICGPELELLDPNSRYLHIHILRVGYGTVRIRIASQSKEVLSHCA
jgi:hypothetical protein